MMDQFSLRSNSIFALLCCLAISLSPQSNPVYAQENDSGKLIVEADNSLEWRRQEQLYIAIGNAIAIQADITLKADRIEASYKDDDKQHGETAGSDNSEGDINITRIKGSGGAELIRGDIIANADMIDYNMVDDRAVLTGGNPRVVSPREQVTAKTSIVYNRSKREVVAEGNAAIMLNDGRYLKANRVFATLNEEENDFTFVQAIGNAEVFSPKATGNQEARADEIEYTKDKGIAILTGSVEMLEGANVMKGDRAEINLDTGVSSITSDSGRVGGVFTSTN
jgi:lipopolysaccharide export system protein LptA